MTFELSKVILKKKELEIATQLTVSGDVTVVRSPDNHVQTGVAVGVCDEVGDADTVGSG
jgi:hypothetical protein